MSNAAGGRGLGQGGNYSTVPGGPSLPPGSAPQLFHAGHGLLPGRRRPLVI